MSAHILVIGQLPPPVHGSNVMTERFMAALEANGYSRAIVEKTFSKKMSQVGRPSMGKLLKVPDLYRRVAAAVDRQRPDLCVYFISVGLSALLVDCLVLGLLRRRRVPYVLYFHGRGYLKYESLRYLPACSLIRAALQGAQGGLVLGERLKEDVSHCMADGCLRVLPNGIPDIAVNAGETFAGSADTVKVVFLSNLIPAKGPLHFLRMAKMVREREPRVRFIMAGRHTTEQYLRELQTYIATEGLGDCVEMIGPIYGQDKDALFRSADVFVFPTEKDIFGLVNLEAMQCSVPVISSPVGAIPDIICDGVNGFIVDPGDDDTLAERVLRLIHDVELRRSMGAAGRALYEQHFSLEAYYRNTRQALEYFLSLPAAFPEGAGEIARPNHGRVS